MYTLVFKGVTAKDANTFKEICYATAALNVLYRAEQLCLNKTMGCTEGCAQASHGTGKFSVGENITCKTKVKR